MFKSAQSAIPTLALMWIMWVQMLIVLVANSLLLLVSRTKGLAPTLMGAFQGPNIKFTIYSLSDKMTQLINIRGGGEL